MKKENNPTTRFLFEQVLKDYATFKDEMILLSENIPIALALFFYFIMLQDIRLIFVPEDIICECGAKTHKHQIVKWKMDNKYLFFKYYHRCPECGKSLKPEMEGIVDEGCCYTNEISDFIMGLYSKEHISYEKSAELFNDENGLDIPRQTVFNTYKKKVDVYLSQKEELIKEKLKEKKYCTIWSSRT